MYSQNKKGVVMLEVLSAQDYQNKLLQLPRPGAEKILAFYEHRVGAICKDARLMLAPLDDHLLHRGDGAFETIRITDRKIIHMSLHLERLQSSAKGLELNLPCTLPEIEDIIVQVAKAGNVAEGNLRVLVGRGPGGFGISPLECPEPSMYIALYQTTPLTEAWYSKGLTAFRSDVPVKAPQLARLKTTNYLSGVLMTIEAITKKMDMALSFDANNCLTEAAIANVGVVDAAGCLVLPEFKNALQGTVATTVMKLAKDFMPVAVRSIPQAELATVQELFILGTAHECVGITHFEGQPIGQGRPGPVAHKLRQLLRQQFLAHGLPF